LREVSCLNGFTRFEAAPTTADGELENVQLAIRSAPLAQDADWLPRDETRRRHEDCAGRRPNLSQGKYTLRILA
jgi:hypothetical protein